MNHAASGWPNFGANLDLSTSTRQLTEGWTQALQGLTGLQLAPEALGQLQADYLREATALWNQAAGQAPGRAPGDRRFAAQDWTASPASAFMTGMYLLNARTLMNMAEHVQASEKTRQRIRFAVQQWVDAAAPSNYLALNPEAQRKALETKGESIAQGLKHLWHDIQQGHVSQTDESQFEVGRNVATTEGAVVYENELFQLVEYKPLTPRSTSGRCYRAAVHQQVLHPRPAAGQLLRSSCGQPGPPRLPGQLGKCQRGGTVLP